MRTDFIQLERILLNLVSNAVRYTDRGGVVVGCRCRGGEAWIEVWDLGIGIPPSECHKIFAEFYRIDDSERDRRTGLGLGLAIVERLCRLLNHTIEVTSAPGRGSHFGVRVPLADLPSAIVQRPVLLPVTTDAFLSELLCNPDSAPTT